MPAALIKRAGSAERLGELPQAHESWRKSLRCRDLALYGKEANGKGLKLPRVSSQLSEHLREKHGSLRQAADRGPDLYLRYDASKKDLARQLADASWEVCFQTSGQRKGPPHPRAAAQMADRFTVISRTAQSWRKPAAPRPIREFKHISART